MARWIGLKTKVTERAEASAGLPSSALHENGSKPWGSGNFDCTARLEENVNTWGEPFLPRLTKTADQASDDDFNHVVPNSQS